MSIASAIATKQQQVAAAYTACDEKGATMPAAGSQNLTNLASTIATISGGGPAPEPSKDIIFIDYDGTELYSYTYSQAAALSALPANPTHTGLTAQGWNWTLAEVQAAGTNKESIIVGQLYTTDDGKTRIYLTIPYNNYWIDFSWYQSAANGVTIDWGDNTGTAKRNATGGSRRIRHCYATAGSYMLTMEVTSGTAKLADGDYGLLELHTDNGCRKTLTNTFVTEINIGNNITELPVGCFRAGRGNLKISLSTSVTTFGSNCFDTTQIKAIVFPRITNLPSYIFSSCQKIETVSLAPTITTINSYAFQYSSIININLSRVTTISNAAFVWCRNFEKADLRSVTTIGANAFENCMKLSFNDNGELRLPALTSLANQAFASCHSIRKVSSLGSITSLGQNEFRYCKQLKEVVLPTGLLTIGAQAFDECYQLESINIPSGVTKIESYTFNKCYQLSSTIPSTITNFQANAFRDCWATRQDIDLTNVTVLGNSSFYIAGITSVTLPSGLTTIGDSVFGYCYFLRSVTIPEGYTTITQYAFIGCGALEELTLPSTITSIGQQAFYRCVSLNITILATTPPTLANSNAFNELLYGAINVPAASVSAYRSASNWSAHKGRIRPISTAVYGTITSNTKLNNGVETAWDGFSTTDYIPIVDGHSFTFSSGIGDSTLTGVTIYDSSYNYLNYWNATQWDRTVTLSSSGNAAYVRLTYLQGTEKGRSYLYDNTTNELIWPTYTTT